MELDACSKSYYFFFFEYGAYKVTSKTPQYD